MLQMTHCPNSGLHMRKEEREAALPFRFMKHSFSVPLLLSFAFFLRSGRPSDRFLVL